MRRSVAWEERKYTGCNVDVAGTERGEERWKVVILDASTGVEEDKRWIGCRGEGRSGRIEAGEEYGGVSWVGRSWRTA